MVVQGEQDSSVNGIRFPVQQENCYKTKWNHTESVFELIHKACVRRMKSEMVSGGILYAADQCSDKTGLEPVQSEM